VAAARHSKMITIISLAVAEAEQCSVSLKIFLERYHDLEI